MMYVRECTLTVDDKYSLIPCVIILGSTTKPIICRNFVITWIIPTNGRRHELQHLRSNLNFLFLVVFSLIQIVYNVDIFITKSYVFIAIE
jgi:hypothetical protein